MAEIKCMRAAINGGRYFYMNEDKRSLCLAVADCEGTRIIATDIRRLDIMFHVHLETGSLEYMKADKVVIAADHLSK